MGTHAKGRHRKNAAGGRGPLIGALALLAGIALCAGALYFVTRPPEPGEDGAAAQPLLVRMELREPEPTPTPVPTPQPVTLTLTAGVDGAAAAAAAAAMTDPVYVPKHYALPEGTTVAPEPAQGCFGETDDPAELEALLQTQTAQRLLDGQTLNWNADIQRIPGTPIRYYLDETILAIVWQECVARAVGTFSEVIVADASQLRRKVVNDEYGPQEYLVATELAAQANAVVAVSGDLYAHPARSFGIGVYDRTLYRCEIYHCDTCYFTGSGDMLFTRRSEIQSEEEAKAFIAENDVLFSVCFGPVLIENGEDVTPESYPLGEINDVYARCALGQLGERHYLAMTINCQEPGYYYLATLRQAADAMLERNCLQAYALDGGQTASIIINDQLINPVQFGFERVTSDILYFATAVPGE